MTGSSSSVGFRGVTLVTGGGAANWADLNDTPATITADRAVRGNAGGTALEFASTAYLTAADADANYLQRDGGNTITGDIPPETNNARDFGSETVRFDKFWGRMGIFLGGDGVISASYRTGAAGRNHGGIIAGSQNLTGTAVHNMTSNSANFPAVLLAGNTYNAYANSTCIFANTGGGASQFGSAYTTYGLLTSRVQTTAFGAFTQVYAWAYGGNSLADNEAPGSVLLGYPATTTSGVVSRARNFNTAAGCFTLARTPYNASGSGESRIYNRGGGSLLVIYSTCNGSGTNLGQVNSGSRGSVVTGYLRNSGANAAQLRTGNNDVGAFATGAVAAITELARIEASADGAMASGYAQNAIISITATGGRGGGFAQASNDITVSGQGGFAWGNSLNGAISATASNAVQFGVGVNAVADSLQVGQTAALGTGLHFHSGGAPGVPVNGDMWVTAAGAVTIMSGGVACVCTNAVM